MTEIILLVGRTGGGKSSLANVLSGKENASAESENSASKTKEIQEISFNFKHGGKEYKIETYQIVDSIGIGDTRLTQAQVLSEISKVWKGSEGKKIKQVLFVVGERLTPEEVNTYNLLKEVFFDGSFSKYTTIIRTRFASFEDEEECKKDIALLRAENNLGITTMLDSNNGFIHVDNPPINIVGSGRRIERQVALNKEIRQESRDKLLKHLNKNCQNSYKLKSWDEVERKFKEKLKEENEKFRKEIENIRANMNKNMSKESKSELEERIRKLEEKIENNQKLIETKFLDRLAANCQIL